MARYDLYVRSGDSGGYVVDVQADLLDQLPTRVVVPLLPHGVIKVVRDLNPIVRIDDKEFILVTQQMSAVPRSILRRRVGSLAEWRDEIIRALDVLLIGF